MRRRKNCVYNDSDLIIYSSTHNVFFFSPSLLRLGWTEIVRMRSIDANGAECMEWIPYRSCWCSEYVERASKQAICRNPACTCCDVVFRYVYSFGSMTQLYVLYMHTLCSSVRIVWGCSMYTLPIRYRFVQSVLVHKMAPTTCIQQQPASQQPQQNVYLILCRGRRCRGRCMAWTRVAIHIVGRIHLCTKHIWMYAGSQHSIIVRTVRSYPDPKHRESERRRRRRRNNNETQIPVSLCM